MQAKRLLAQRMRAALQRTPELRQVQQLQAEVALAPGPGQVERVQAGAVPAEWVLLRAELRLRQSIFPWPCALCPPVAPLLRLDRRRSRSNRCNLLCRRRFESARTQSHKPKS
jgi:hypothetical protein